MLTSRDTAGTPMLLDQRGRCLTLARVTLGGGVHSEGWLQQLIFEHPGMLPIVAIEPAFHDAHAVACEVPCGHGFIDNLYVTPRGDIVLVEAKLWKNPQARRELVAQVLDYVAALMRMSYDQFEAAIAKGAPTRMTGSLWQVVKDHPEALSEARFIDAVARNLARGRLLALAVGDGIRGEARALGDLLQGHAGAHFTFALVELGVWSNPETGEQLVIPNTLAQTVMIERGIVVSEPGSNIVQAIAPKVAAAAKPHTISDAVFGEQIAAVAPGLPQAIADFLKLVEPLGVYGEQKAALSLKVDHVGAKPINLGVIDKTGKLWTDYVMASVPLDLARRYVEQLARLIGGTVVDPAKPKLTINGKTTPTITDLLPANAVAWSDIIAALLRDLVARREEEAA